MARSEQRRKLDQYLGRVPDVRGTAIHDVCSDFSESHIGVEQPSILPMRAIRKRLNRRKNEDDN